MDVDRPHRLLTSFTWISCPRSSPFSEGFSLAQILLIFSIRPRQQIESRSATFLLTRDQFHSTYLPIVCRVFFPPHQYTPHSFYRSLIQHHSTFSSTGCILDVPNTSRIVSTEALFSYLEFQETLHTLAFLITVLEHFSVVGNAVGD